MKIHCNENVITIQKLSKCMKFDYTFNIVRQKKWPGDSSTHA